MHMHGTRIALPEDAKTELVTMLNQVLATAIDLRSQVKQAHWNTRGPQFFARHLLFDRPVPALTETIDNTAERVSTLGGYATGTVRLSAGGSQLPEYDLRIRDGKQHINALCERFAMYAGQLRNGITVAKKTNDPVTEDLLTEALRRTELDLWFLESHLA